MLFLFISFICFSISASWFVDFAIHGVTTNGIFWVVVFSIISIIAFVLFLWGISSNDE